MFWRVVNSNMNQRAVRDGDWKLLIDSPGRAMLYDLRNDVGERNDVAASNTAVVRRLPSSCRRGKKTSTPNAKASSEHAAS